MSTKSGQLQLLLLVDSGRLTKSQAQRVATKIHDDNSQITKTILDDFLVELSKRVEA
jgi:hypothetical protein